MLAIDKTRIEKYKGYGLWYIGYMDRDQYIGRVYARKDGEPVFAIEKVDVDLESCKPLIDRIKSDIDVRVEEEKKNNNGED